MASVIFQDITTNFKDLLENSTTGVESFLNVVNSFSESTDSISLETEAGSIFNGKFSTQLAGINSIRQDLGTGVVDYEYDIKLSVAFTINTRGSKDQYNNAISDIEEIIRKRLNDSTWSNSTILLIDFVSCSPMRFLHNETEEYGIIDIVFRVQGRTYLDYG